VSRSFRAAAIAHIVAREDLETAADEIAEQLQDDRDPTGDKFGFSSSWTVPSGLRVPCTVISVRLIGYLLCWARWSQEKRRYPATTVPTMAPP
jgi:hypothetical protein